MRSVLRLGLRLAGVGAMRGAGRLGWLRSAMVAVSAAVGTVLMLGVAAIARTETSLHPDAFVSGMKILLASIVAVIAVTVLMLAAAAGRLSAALRDRRLANLRLLGLPPLHTRVVAVVETGAAAVTGSLAGALVFLAVRPILHVWSPANRKWTTETLWPMWLDWVLILLLVPGAVVAISALPQRVGGSDVLALARLSNAERPRVWRLAPLVAGVLMASYLVGSSWLSAAEHRSGWVMFTGMVLLGVGMILAIPVFVRLVADGLVRRADHPVLWLAGRRLQAQPAAMTRVVAGLLVGLFIVTGSRALVVAFEDTSQYRSEARMNTTGQVGSLRTTMAHANEVRQHTTSVEGVRDTATLVLLVEQQCQNDNGRCLHAVVGTCDELRLAAPDVRGCRDDEAQWLYHRGTVLPNDISTKADPLVLGSTSPRVVSLSTPRHRLDIGGTSLLDPADVFVPTHLLEAHPVSARTGVEVVVVAEPGVSMAALIDKLSTEHVQGAKAPGMDYYSFVSGLRAAVWAIAAVTLGVGLLSFSIAAIDRAISRRPEVMALQLAGVSPGVLRRTQWIEAALPLAAGTVLAITLGLLAGASYLAYGDILDMLPWRQTLTLAGVAVVGASFVAAVTVIASSPRIRAELIRTE